MEKLLYGLLVAVVGMVIVFVCLIMLILLFKLMSAIVRGIEKPKTVKKPKTEETEIQENRVQETVQEAVMQDDEEEVAAAIAAVMMMLAENNENIQGLRVRSVRRIGVNTPAWGRVSRNDFVSGL